MEKKKKYSLQDALAVIQGSDSESEGCEDSSDDDPEDPDIYSTKDLWDDESSESGDSDLAESPDLDEAPQPSITPGQKSPSPNEKRQFSWRKKPFEVHIQRTECLTPR